MVGRHETAKNDEVGPWPYCREMFSTRQSRSYQMTRKCHLRPGRPTFICKHCAKGAPWFALLFSQSREVTFLSPPILHSLEVTFLSPPVVHSREVTFLSPPVVHSREVTFLSPPG